MAVHVAARRRRPSPRSSRIADELTRTQTFRRRHAARAIGYRRAHGEVRSVVLHRGGARRRRARRGAGGRRADPLLARERVLRAHGRRGGGGPRRRARADAGHGARPLPALPPRPHVPRRPADGSVGPAAEPSPAADWRVQERRRRRLHATPPSAGRPRTRRCGSSPRRGLCGLPRGRAQRDRHARKGAVPYGRVGGFVEGHMHWMTFEYFGGNFHCGRPWHPYGIAYALPDCSSIEGPQGVAAPLQNFLNFGNPAPPHDTRGYPQMTEWRNGQPHLRGHVLALDPARVAGGPAADGHGRQREPRAVRAAGQPQDQLQRDGHGAPRLRRRCASCRATSTRRPAGPGKGFFQIVTDPFEARRVINNGQMAIVLEIEISEPFDCRGWDARRATRRRSTASSRRCTASACAPRCC